jgi:hypothetical protein
VTGCLVERSAAGDNRQPQRAVADEVLVERDGCLLEDLPHSDHKRPLKHEPTVTLE